MTGAPHDAGERAIIDIGSNTVRLVIYGPPARAPSVLHNEKVTARLGKGLAERGEMGEKAMGQALTALARYAALLRLRGLRDVETVATAAVRDAANGPAFLARVVELGLAPRLLSGEEEAIASARGVQAAFPGAVGLVGDLGGGSLELIDIDCGPDGPSATHGTSLRLGTLLLPGLRAGGHGKFAEAVKAMLAAADWRGGDDQDFYLVGGSWRALGRFAMLRERWPIDDPHGFALAPDTALRIARGLREGRFGSGDALSNHRSSDRRAGGAVPVSAKAASRAMILHPLAEGMQVSPSRLASLPDAAALLDVLVRELRPRRLVFSAWGLREGLLARAMPLADDPLLAGVSAFVGNVDPGIPAAAAQVAGWSAAIDPAGVKDPARERLRHAAIMLALASMRTEPNLRPELAASWALRKRWIGISDAGRAMLALAVLANSGRTAIPEDLLRLANAHQLREALLWGLATRLARRMTGGAARSGPVLAQASLAVADGRLTLAVPADLRPLLGEAVEKDIRLLAECLGVEGVILRQ